MGLIYEYWKRKWKLVGDKGFRNRVFSGSIVGEAYWCRHLMLYTRGWDPKRCKILSIWKFP